MKDQDNKEVKEEMGEKEELADIVVNVKCI